MSFSTHNNHSIYIKAGKSRICNAVLQVWLLHIIFAVITKNPCQTTIGMKIKKLTREDAENFLQLLRARFENNISRHNGMHWENIRKKLENSAQHVVALSDGTNRR